jgi:hypothetical protein
LFIGGLTSFLVGISWGGIQYEWKSVQTITPIVVGIITIVIAVLWEIYYAREPFLRPSLFNSPSALATYASALFQGFIVCSPQIRTPETLLTSLFPQLFCALYYVPFYFSSIKFDPPTQTGLNIFPVTCLLLPGSIIISLITTRTGRYRWAIWGGWVVTTIGCGLFVLLDADTTTPVWAIILAIFGIGHGILLTSVNVGIQAVSRVEDAGRAAAMYAFMRTLGMSIGVAVGGTVFQNVMSNKLDELGLPGSIAHNSEVFVHTMSLMDPEDPTRLAAIQACKLIPSPLWSTSTDIYPDLAGFHGVYWTITGTAIASFFISLIIRRHSMVKVLASDFTLKGARVPVALARGYAGANTGSLEMMSVGNHLPPIMKGSPSGRSITSASERTGRARSATKRSGTPPTWPQEREGESSDGGAKATEEPPVVAYYIQPGGRIVPVDTTRWL